MVVSKYFTLGSSGQKELGAEFDFNQLSLVKDVTRTVDTSGADFTTLEEAVNSFNDSFLGDDCIIDILTAATVSALDFDSIYGKLVIRGDTRDMAGNNFFNGAEIISASANAGSGTCTITKTGAQQLTVTGSGGNPDFGAAGVVSGDSFEIGRGTGGTHTRFIDSVSGNVLNFTGTVNDAGEVGGFIYFKPNKEIDLSNAPITNKFLKVVVIGFDIDKNDTDPLFEARQGGNIELQNCAVRNLAGENIICDGGIVKIKPGTCTFHDSDGIQARNGGIIICRKTGFVHPNSAEQSIKAEKGGKVDCCESNFLNTSNNQQILVENGGTVIAKNCRLYSLFNTADGAFCINRGSHLDLTDSTIDSGSVGSGDGVTVQDGATARLTGATINNFAIGFNVERSARADIINGGCTNCTTGIRASHNSYVDATGTGSNMSGNTTDYSPPSNDVEGNVNSTITRS